MCRIYKVDFGCSNVGKYFEWFPYEPLLNIEYLKLDKLIDQYIKCQKSMQIVIKAVRKQKKVHSFVHRNSPTNKRTKKIIIHQQTNERAKNETFLRANEQTNEKTAIFVLISMNERLCTPSIDDDKLN